MISMTIQGTNIPIIIIIIIIIIVIILKQSLPNAYA